MSGNFWIQIEMIAIDFSETPSDIEGIVEQF